MGENDTPKKKTVQSLGGEARAAKLSARRKSEIGSAGANARWGLTGEVPQTSYVGELKLGDESVPCAVLPDGTRVLSQRGFARVLGRTYGGRTLSPGGGEVPLFLLPETIKSFAGADLMAVLFKTRPYSHTKGGGTAIGIKATALPLLCDAWLRAREAGALRSNQEKTAARAEILVRALSQTAIEALVDEATGYQEVRPKDALQQYLAMLVRKELAAWSKKFPDEFYENIYKLNNWPWTGMSKNRYGVVAHYTRDLVYERLAPGLLEELEKHEPPDERGRRQNKFHQWLTDEVGNPMLAQHLHSLIMFQRLALQSNYGWKRFVRMVDRVMPRKGRNLELALPETEELVN